MTAGSMAEDQPAACAVATRRRCCPFTLDPVAASRRPCVPIGLLGRMSVRTWIQAMTQGEAMRWMRRRPCTSRCDLWVRLAESLLTATSRVSADAIPQAHRRRWRTRHPHTRSETHARDVQSCAQGSQRKGRLRAARSSPRRVHDRHLPPRRPGDAAGGRRQVRQLASACGRRGRWVR